MIMSTSRTTNPARMLALGLMFAAIAIGCTREPVALGVANYSEPLTAPRCEVGTRVGAAGATDTEITDTGVHYSVRTPADYDATFPHPLIVVYAPASKNRYASERYSDLTYAATRAGFVIAYADALPLARNTIQLLGEIPARVAAKWCVDTGRVFFTGHSDGGSYSMGVTFLKASSIAPAAIAPSGAGIRGADLARYRCPAPLPVMVIHSAHDERFPGWGREAAQWWARCNGCATNLGTLDSDGCRDYAGCPLSARTRYCEGHGEHRSWPGLNSAILDFFRAAR